MWVSFSNWTKERSKSEKGESLSHPEGTIIKACRMYTVSNVVSYTVFIELLACIVVLSFFRYSLDMNPCKWYGIIDV